MTNLPELDRIEQRAQRQLDGMTVNRDALASDTLRLCRLVRRLRDQVAVQPKPEAKSDDGVADLFEFIFGGLNR